MTTATTTPINTARRQREKFHWDVARKAEVSSCLHQGQQLFGCIAIYTSSSMARHKRGEAELKKSFVSK
jgi:hypothetical protein